MAVPATTTMSALDQALMNLTSPSVSIPPQSTSPNIKFERVANMVRRSKRIAAANEACKSASKKTKLSEAKELPQKSSAAMKKRGATKQDVDSTVFTNVIEGVSKDDVELPTSNEVNPNSKAETTKQANDKPKLDKLPAEIQQQIYWLAIEDDCVPHRKNYRDMREVYRSTSFKVLRVSRGVKEHVVKATEVWGPAYFKEFVSVIKEFAGSRQFQPSIYDILDWEYEAAMEDQEEDCSAWNKNLRTGRMRW